MENFDVWKILGIIAVVLLFVFWKRRNAVWGGFTLGIIIGLVVALFSGFDLYIIGKGSILGVMVGLGAEFLGKISDFIKKQNK